MAVPPAARLEPMLVRLPPTLADQLRELARVTRIRQSEYLREAVADLLAKYRRLRPDAAEPLVQSPQHTGSA